MTNPVASFQLPYMELSKITGKPNYLSLSALKKQLVANSVSVFSSRGNGALGHAMLVLGQADYDARAVGNNWVNPPCTLSILLLPSPCVWSTCMSPMLRAMDRSARVC